MYFLCCKINLDFPFLWSIFFPLIFLSQLLFHFMIQCHFPWLISLRYALDCLPLKVFVSLLVLLSLFIFWIVFFSLIRSNASSSSFRHHIGKILAFCQIPVSWLPIFLYQLWKFYIFHVLLCNIFHLEPTSLYYIYVCTMYMLFALFLCILLVPQLNCLFSPYWKTTPYA